MVLSVLLVGEQPERKASHVCEHIYLPTDEPVVDEVISVRTEYQHILGYLISYRREIVKLHFLRVAVSVRRFVCVTAVFNSPVDDRGIFLLSSRKRG